MTKEMTGGWVASQKDSPLFLVCSVPLSNLNEVLWQFHVLTSTLLLSLNMQGPQDTNQHNTQPDKIGWIRKFCGKGIFREIWKNRFVILKGDQLYISEKEVSDASSLNSWYLHTLTFFRALNTYFFLLFKCKQNQHIFYTNFGVHCNSPCWASTQWNIGYFMTSYRGL